MSLMCRYALPCLALAALTSLAGCSDESLAKKSEPSLGEIGKNIVTHGAFTNLYVLPSPSTQTWDTHIATLRPNDAADFSRAALDAIAARSMAPTWPSYYDPLFQYHCGFSTDCGINPPQFFGSGIASQACVDALIAEMNNGVVQWDDVGSLANCHLDGMDPSPQVNVIFSPDIPIGKIDPLFGAQPEMCSTSGFRAWHAWGLNKPDHAALPTSTTCAPSITRFSRSMSHEIVEILTDPAGTGYGDFPNYVAEAADLCENLPDAWTVVNGDSLSRYWSNSDDNCQPRLDPPSGSESTTWILGEGSPLKRFTGEVHDFALGVPSPRVNTDATATQVLIVFKTGKDNLRGGSDNADVTLSFAGGTTLTTNVNQGHNWDEGQTHSAILNLPSTPIRVSDITGVTISTHFGGGLGGENWNLDKVALVVSYPTGSTVTVPPRPIVHSWLDVSELPLVRFTGAVHDKRLELAPADVGLEVESLDLVISTGNDDLKGGSNAGDNCDVDFELASGNVISVKNVNQNQTWEGWTIHKVSLPVPPGLTGGDVKAVTLRTGFGGGESGDNWNVQRVQLLAAIDPAAFLNIAITSPTATDYAHSATLTFDYAASDAGGPGLADVTATLDGSSTISGTPISSGLTIALLTTLDLGPHTFTVNASDVWGNSKSSSVTFNVVVTPSSVIDEVADLAGSGAIASTLKIALISKLDAAADARARGECDTAAQIYKAFIALVKAQTPRNIDPDAAAILIADVQYLIEHCP